MNLRNSSMTQTKFDNFPASWRFVLIHKGGKNPICLSDDPEGWAASALQWGEAAKNLGKTVRGYSDKRKREGKDPWYRTQVGAIGCLAGAASGGLLFVDCDGESATALLQSWGEVPGTWAVRSGRPGRQQLVFQVPQQFWGAIETTKIQTGDDEGLELRWSGCQSVVFGQHPTTKQPYQWFGTDGEIAEAPLHLIEKMLIAEKSRGSQGGTSVSWRGFDRSFQLPCVEVVPLEVFLRREDRELIERGADGGVRNDSGFKLAANLMATAEYLDRIGQRYDGIPEQMFERFCQSCAGGAGWSQREWDQIWRSAQKRDRSPALPPDAMETSAKAWVWKNCVKTASASASASTESRSQNGKESEDSGKESGKRSRSKPEGNKHKLVTDYELIKETFGDRLAFNTLKNAAELDGQPIEVETSKHVFVIHHGLWLNSGKEDVADIVMMIAKERSYNPIEKYLDECYQKYGDDTSILYRFAERYFGQSDPIYTIFTIRFLVASVARIYEPGCKHDNALILQGGQGIRKSTFFKVLASEQWFDDSLGGISDKDEKLKLHQTWFMEWAELETIFKRKDLSATKAFLSSGTDRLRPPYGRSVIEMPRRCTIVGTTNQDEFLNDVTGNRRFWVIPVKVDHIDTTMLAQERDRIWAAAVALYKRGECWHLMSCEEQAAVDVAQQFQSEDPWLMPVSQWLEGSSGAVTTAAILTNALKIETGRQDKAAQMRVTDILKTLGWESIRKYVDGSRQRVWVVNRTTRTTHNQEVVPYINTLESTLKEFFEDHGTTRTTGTTQNLKPKKDVDEKTDQENLANANNALGKVAVPVVPVVPNQAGRAFETGQPLLDALSRPSDEVVPSLIGRKVIDPFTHIEATITDVAQDEQGVDVCFLNGQVNGWRFLESIRDFDTPPPDTSI